MKTKKLQVGEGSVEKAPKEVEKQEVALAQGLHPNVLIFEDGFVKNYHSVETQQKEREIKFFSCVGDPALSEVEKAAISGQRQDNGKYLVEFNKNKDIHRYELTSTSDRVVVPGDLPLRPECKWNTLNNDLFSLRQRHLNNLVKMATTLMVRIRTSIRLEKLRARFEQVGQDRQRRKT